MWELIDKLRAKRFIDLTHAFSPGIPHASDMPDETSHLLFDFPKDGFRAHKYEHAGQWGTHVDPPIHFIEGGRTLDQIAVDDMICPLVVLDAEAECQNNSDYILDVSRIEAWEKQYGKIPSRAFVAMKSGWSRKWPSSIDMFNRDPQGTAHFPGWSLETVRYLVEQRNIVAIAHETTDTDGGIAISRGSYECERYLLAKDKFQIELIASLDNVPLAGAIAVVAFPKPLGGSGYPARVFALA